METLTKMRISPLVSRSNPKNKAVVNVEPERDTPGIKASVCPNPTKIPSQFAVNQNLAASANFSAKASKSAIMIDINRNN